ncbi:MAG: hypothetical protein FJZ47_04330 [Candidatus Tectomicrobia bacterium]|uniref:PilZ domain-containing protein n=1 Tax=Tectimicrobiota bacterium TaxID=2528274 RepID=A0A938AZV3_UNCTE|nr:hypothetical protein [Candidatus Tectomicrobia bacterium]
MGRILIHLDDQYGGTLVCPQCSKKYLVDLRQQCPTLLERGGEKHATIACRCGADIAVTFDCRRHLRKDVQLRGTLREPRTQVPLSTIVVTSVSVEGVGFLLTQPLHLSLGRLYTIRFRLDDSERTLVQETVIIRRLQETLVGAEFHPSELYQHDLDFYVYGADLLPPPRQVLTPR